MKITFEKNITQNFDEALQHEWLETNGLGGWAGSTICGANSRRYHGLLVAATQPPAGRMVLLSKLEETIISDGQRFELGCNRYPNGYIHPHGYRYLQRFRKEIFPHFEYTAGGIELRKTIAAVNGENTTLIIYEVRKAPTAFTLELRPFVAVRDFHSLMHKNDAIRQNAQFQKGIFRVRPYDGAPEIFISLPGAEFQGQPDWYYQFEYHVELYRGLDFQEDLFTYGVFRRTLKPGDIFGIIVSTENPESRDPLALLKKEQKRRKALQNSMRVQDEFSKTLALAADQFVVKRGADLQTIIAGYHWFADWGRDTMIALPGICLVTGRFDDAKKILRAFAQSVSQGMLPNRFPDISTSLNAGAGETPEYNTVDATLWFFVAIYKYLHYSGDEAFVQEELMPVLRDIIDWHERGTRYNIHVDEDGLLYAGEPGVQLTWMDAKIGDWVVTPRQGKAVDINALWYNALTILAELSKRFGDEAGSETFEKKAKQVKRRFNEVFWFEEGQYLYDYLDGNHRDTAIRPNQLFAISLPFSLLTKKRASLVLGIVGEKLLTPVGLRSLAADDPAYRPHYGGNAYYRDSAYHQGTVWAWLMGPFISALVRVKGEAGKKRAGTLLKTMAAHLNGAGLGSISEIFDAEAPHTPRGCIAQAWSVGEVLRAYLEDVADLQPRVLMQNEQFALNH